jgi:hypothetical protein
MDGTKPIKIREMKHLAQCFLDENRQIPGRKIISLSRTDRQSEGTIVTLQPACRALTTTVSCTWFMVVRGGQEDTVVNFYCKSKKVVQRCRSQGGRVGETTGTTRYW